MAQTNRNIDNMSPFITFCQHVIPLSYDESLSYYETLCALRNYIGEMVEAVNNNADAVTELQNKFTELQNYVDNYFKNLDVQEEINTKLDEMATDGTLENIINEQIFGEINDKIDSNYNDLSGKIQTNTESIQTNASNIETNKQSIQTNATKIEENTEAINQINEKMNAKKGILILGDSFTDESEVANTQRQGVHSWVENFKKLYNQYNVFNYSETGAGFVNPSSTKNNNFLGQLNLFLTEQPNEIENIEKIIIYGGYNDYFKSVGNNNIKNAILLLYNKIQTTFKCQTYLFYINIGQQWIDNTNYNDINDVLYYAQENTNFIVNKSTGWLIGGTNFVSDALHPNDAGMKRILECVHACLTGSTELNYHVGYGVLKKDNASDNVPYTIHDNQLYYNPLTGNLHGTLYYSLNSAIQVGNAGGVELNLETDIYGGLKQETYFPYRYHGADGSSSDYQWYGYSSTFPKTQLGDSRHLHSSIMNAYHDNNTNASIQHISLSPNVYIV